MPVQGEMPPKPLERREERDRWHARVRSLEIFYGHPSPFKWQHFEGEMILLCVRWYLRYALSYRDVEELMRERGVPVDHTTIFRWVQHDAPELDTRCRPQLKATTDSYRVDETYRYCWRMKPSPCQRCKPRHAGMGARSMHEPSRQSIEIQRGGTRHLLHVGLRQADITTASEAKHPHALGQRALNASALGIKAVPGGTLQIGPHAINGCLLRLRLELETARLRLCTGTARAWMTACTVRLGACDSDVAMPIGMLKRIPPDRVVPLRTAGAAGSPVHRQRL
jgi:hypothetical protein